MSREDKGGGQQQRTSYPHPNLTPFIQKNYCPHSIKRIKWGGVGQDKYMNFPYPPCPFFKKFNFFKFYFIFKFKYIKINIKVWKKTFSIWSLVLMQYMRYELLLKSNYSLLWEKKYKKYVNDISALVWFPSLIKFWWDQILMKSNHHFSS